MKKIIWSLVVIVIIVGLVWFFKSNGKESTNIVYKEVKVVSSNMEITILSTGSVQPANRLEIKPPIPGRVEDILVKEGEKVKKGQLLAWMSSTERAALLDAARSKGAEEYKRWEEFYRPTPIVAPINGSIIQRNVEPGQVFTSSDAVLVMSDRLTVKANVDETDIAQIKNGQNATIILDAYSKQSIDAKVDKIAYDAKTVNNVTTYVIDVLPNNTPDYMRSGMTANVVFYVEKKDNVLKIPSDAVKVLDNKYYVLVKPSNKKDLPQEKYIEIGLNDGKYTEVLSGLVEGEVVLVAEISSSLNKSKKSSNPFLPTRPGQTGKK